MIVFLQLLNAYGPYYFDSIRNWDKEKNKLLEAYGYQLSDNLEGKFEFSYKDGKPFLRVLDPTIKRVSPQDSARLPRQACNGRGGNCYGGYLHPRMKQMQKHFLSGPSLRLGVVFNFNAESYPGWTLDAISGEANESFTAFTGKVEKLDLSKFVNIDAFGEQDKQLFAPIRKMQESEITKYLNRNSPFSGIWENIIHHEKDELPEETKALMSEYLHPKLKKLFMDIASNPFIFYLNGKKAFKTSNLHTVGVVTDFITPHGSK